ncbi:glutathione S-transferase family protein [Marivita sp. S6314]|uniref:glutathione S-transferase family protein n=1 Tax=Marivita sp. S6314 TaxID=2926406 RepID=UPI001FF30A74|nr:glutathione S-transferase family protein [Marivita sp. S6314]MCK0149266.1 glutathione S-transferase family protein [Marivita sp. S6314]
MLTLYYAKGSSALASHILLEEVGADYAVHEVPIQHGAHKEPAFLAVNPKARVPALQTPEGVLTENPAILNYVAATHPQAGMLPDTPFQRAQADALNAYLCATMHVAFAHKLRGARWADTEEARADMANKVAENLADCCALLEEHYIKGPWALGDQFTVCDAYLALVPLWLGKAGVDISAYPKLQAHSDAMKQRPAALTVMAIHGI